MSRSRLPLVALVGAVGCTTQEAPTPDGVPHAATSPLQKLKDTFFSNEEQGKGSGIRALPPEERRNFLSKPIPVPAGTRAQATPVAPEARDGGTVSDGGTAVDYAEQRRQQYEQRHEQRLHGKGSGIQRREIIQIIRPTDSGTAAPPTPAPTSLEE
ncbi:hypothetical protein [Archangium sp.]|jgi:hypothetical protein|uniref:hypothetical protein n=1 Tax=Archangium sp. TaxID=1872627 RepID=UPI002ED8B2DC